jgi:hypothetical protein
MRTEPPESLHFPEILNLFLATNMNKGDSRNGKPLELALHPLDGNERPVLDIPPLHYLRKGALSLL